MIEYHYSRPDPFKHGPVEASLAVTCNTITHINLFERAFASECGISRSTAESNKVEGSDRVANWD